MDRTTLTAALKPLLRRSLIKITTDHDDRRARLLELTRQGRRLLARAVPVWTTTHAALEARLGPGEQNLVWPNWSGGSPRSVDPHQIRTYTVITAAGPVQEQGHFAFDPGGLSETCYGGCSTPTFGSLPRDFFRAPGRVNLDLSQEKRTQLTERVAMIFRAEFFNILNHTQWQSPVASAPLNSLTPQVGQITSTFDPRIGQLALRFSY